MQVDEQPFVPIQVPVVHTSLTDRLRGLLFTLLLTVGLFLALTIPRPLSQQVRLQVGDVSDRDIRAPARLSYVSEVLTERERARAAAAVPDVYDPPQSSVAREQINRARDILGFIERVRADPLASEAQQVAWLQAIADLHLNDALIEQTLSLPPESWQKVADEILLVLDRAMREEIREGQIAAARRMVPTLVSLELADNEAQVVTEYVRALLRPNAFLNPARTEAERQAARDRVELVYARFEAGEAILRAGDIVDELDLEALEAAGLLQQPPRLRTLLSHALFSLLLAVCFSLTIYCFKPIAWLRRRQPWLLAVLTILFAFIAQLMVPTHPVLPFVFPLATMAMLLGVLLDLRFPLVATAIMTLFLGYITDGAMAIMTYAFLGSLAGALILGHGERLSLFIYSGLAVALTNLTVLAAYNLPQQTLNPGSLVELAAAAILNGGLSASLTIIGLLLAGPIFGVLTILQLMDLSRPTHPLLRQLLLTAPGTYHHTLVVSNMAERAAAAIGADAFLTRVGTYYHDIGKMARPYFFVENQAEGQNPHDHLDPLTSAQIIIGHVTDGATMARAHGLPQRIVDFIVEHHGTSLVSYFYQRACSESGNGKTVDETPYRYPGPRPQSRETAIVMLADVCEAAVRATRPATAAALDDLITRLVNERLAEGQLDDSALTLRDLEHIRRAFVTVLQGVHHPRIQYSAPLLGQLPRVALANETHKKSRRRSPRPTAREQQEHPAP